MKPIHLKRQGPEKPHATNDNDPHDDEIDGATPQQTQLTKQRRNELFRCCAKLAKSENVLDEFSQAVFANGLAGERRNARLIFLAVLTSLFPRPVSVAVKGSSSGGKNTLVSAVLKFFPPTTYYEMTGMSEKALAYFSEPLKNRVLVITEAAGLQGKDGLVFLRCLLSEGSLRYVATVGKKTIPVEIEGPTGLVITTTDLQLYHDDETRLFSIEVADTPAQNRKVFDFIGESEVAGHQEMGTPGPEWHALMRLIAAKPKTVVNPYGTAIASLVPENSPPRLRRDLKSVFALVRAHALLHQKTRKRRADGAIIATLKDYKAVRSLVKDIVAEGAQAAVPAGVRRLVETVGKLTKAAEHVSGAALAKELNLDKSGISRAVNAATTAGYLLNVQEGKGRAAMYVLGDPLPKDNGVLPSAKAVAKEYRKRLAKDGKAAKAKHER